MRTPVLFCSFIGKFCDLPYEIKNTPRAVHRCIRKSFAFGKSHLACKVVKPPQRLRGLRAEVGLQLCFFLNIFLLPGGIPMKIDRLIGIITLLLRNDRVTAPESASQKAISLTKLFLRKKS